MSYLIGAVVILLLNSVNLTYLVEDRGSDEKSSKKSDEQKEADERKLIKELYSQFKKDYRSAKTEEKRLEVLSTATSKLFSYPTAKDNKQFLTEFGSLLGEKDD